MKLETGLSPCNRPSQTPRNTRVKVTLIARPLLTRKLFRCEHGVFTSRKCVHSQTSFAAFSNAYPDRAVPNTTTGKKVSGQRESFPMRAARLATKRLKLRSHGSDSASNATEGYGCKNSLLSLVPSFGARGFCSS
jgi:hypothetical protein